MLGARTPEAEVIGDRVVYNTARAITSQLGEAINPLKLDPFVERADHYEDDEVQIVTLRQLAQAEDGSVVTVERVLIEVLEADFDALLDDDDDEDEGDWERDVEDEDQDDMVLTSVFDYVDNGQSYGSFLYVPGPWLKHLRELGELVKS
jgi:hypothetical protein